MSIQELEKKAFQLFEKGEFKRALLGDDTFFMRDDLAGDHSSLGVFFCVFDWLKTKSDYAIYLNKLKDDLVEMCSVKGESDPSRFLQIITDYCIAVKYRNFDPVGKDFIINLIKHFIAKFSKEEYEMYQIGSFIDILRAYLPEL